MSDRVDHLVQEYADTQARLADPTVVEDLIRGR